MTDAELLRAAAGRLRGRSMASRFELRVADGLDKEAEGVESGSWRPCVNAALAVARAVMGGDE